MLLIIRTKEHKANLFQHRKRFGFLISHAVLAESELPVYITTNYVHFMEFALKDKSREPFNESCVWNEDLKCCFLEYSIACLALPGLDKSGKEIEHAVT